MGTFDDARAAASSFGQAIGDKTSQLQGCGQSTSGAHQAFQGVIGNTSQPKGQEANALSQSGKQSIADAIGSLIAAKEAVSQFGDSLG